MKKVFLWAIMILFIFTMVIMGTSCKKAAPTAEVTTTVVAETTEGEATTTTAAETTAAATESVVAASDELYIWSCYYWGIEVMKPYLWGGYVAAKELGVKFEYTGPTDGDADKTIAGLEAGLAKKPTGLLWLNIGMGDKLVTDYYNSGGMIAGMNGTTGPYPQTLTVGTDNVYYGAQQAQFVVDQRGEKLNIGVMTLPTADNHIKRMAGVNSILEKYPNIKTLGIMDQTGDSTGAAQNASAFLAANPNVDAIICTSALGGAAVGRAIKEAGIEPGKIFVIAGDMDQELLDLIEEGYVSASLAQSFAVETYYAILAMHTIKNSSLHVSNDDKAVGFTAGPANIITALPFITKDNLQYFRGLVPPEGFKYNEE